MTTRKILIQKTDMVGDLALFAPGVKRGGTVYFSSNVTTGCKVTFPNDSPFQSPGLLPRRRTSRSVPLDATLGIYQFKVEYGNVVAYLQLAVERDGVDPVGFSVEDDGIHTQLWAPKGPVTIYFSKNVVNEEATVSVVDGKVAQPPITIPHGRKQKRTKPLDLKDKLSVQLGGVAQESGGTRVVDIIVGP